MFMFSPVRKFQYERFGNAKVDVMKDLGMLRLCWQPCGWLLQQSSDFTPGIKIWSLAGWQIQVFEPFCFRMISIFRVWKFNGKNPAPMKHSWPKFRRSRNITYICLWGLVSVGLGIMAIISDIIPAITGVLTFDIFSLVVMISVPLVYFLAGAFAWHLYNDYREDHGKKAAQFDPFKSLGQFSKKGEEGQYMIRLRAITGSRLPLFQTWSILSM